MMMMMMMLSFHRFSYALACICWVLLHGSLCEKAAPVVQLPHLGHIQGSWMESIKGRPFQSFRGIPYAEPPVGPLRFAPPVAKKPWMPTLLDATEAPTCTQALDMGVIVETEDCLCINVYAPEESTSKKALPVLVFIHGGGFIRGTINVTGDKGARKLLDKDLVLVFMAYRLGPFGFLSTGDQASSGNYGLLDQLLALQWIQTNIQAFGGDPSKVTLAGQSAGAACVTYHMVSPLSKGLFRGAIAMSGSALGPWAFQKDPWNSTHELARRVGCSSVRDSWSLVNCLRGIPAAVLVNASTDMMGRWGSNPFHVWFGPSVDSWAGDRSFLPNSPLEFFENGTFQKMPFMSGTTLDELEPIFSGCYETGQFLAGGMNETFIATTFKDYVAMFTKYNGFGLQNVSEAIWEEYYGDIDLMDQAEINKTTIDFFSDAMLRASHAKTVQLVASTRNGSASSVYAYSFDYLWQFKHSRYAVHADDLYALDDRTVLTGKDQELSETMVDLWTNFVTYLEPSVKGDSGDRRLPEWRKTSFNESEIDYLRIGNDAIEMQHGFHKRKMEFWNRVIPDIIERFHDSQNS